MQLTSLGVYWVHVQGVLGWVVVEPGVWLGPYRVRVCAEAVSKRRHHMQTARGIPWL